MNKKNFIVTAVLLLVCATGAFAFSIGVQGGGSFTGGSSVGAGAAITFKLDSSPLVFAADLDFGDGFAVGLSADYWFLNDNIVGPLNYFIGVGAGFTIGGFNDDLLLNMAVRVPIGLNLFLVDGIIEPYIQIVPMLSIPIMPNFDLRFVGAANLGIRFWF
ncbi:MAG: hypothetical protein J6B81_04340 [Spirochaetaceae bacterium]|nr:hypothetical protein [Spirochaetaceae bacterium]